MGYFGRSIISGGLIGAVFDVAGVSSDDLFHIKIDLGHNESQFIQMFITFKKKTNNVTAFMCNNGQRWRYSWRLVKRQNIPLCGLNSGIVSFITVLVIMCRASDVSLMTSVIDTILIVVVVA